jgi:hypothetical protein
VSELEALLALAADVEVVRAVAEDLGWTLIEHNALVVVVEMSSRVDAETYRLRFVCPGYPEHAPSIMPIDPTTGGSDTVAAWPSCAGFRPVSDICMPLSAEGFALHPAWNDDPTLSWIPSGNPLLRVLEELQAQIDNPAKYRGRTTG